MMLTTGISMLGKMSVGVRTIASVPRRRIRITSTTMVCGCFSASLTIHMIQVLNLFVRPARTVSTKSTLWLVVGVSASKVEINWWAAGAQQQLRTWQSAQTGQQFPHVISPSIFLASYLDDAAWMPQRRVSEIFRK